MQFEGSGAVDPVVDFDRTWSSRPDLVEVGEIYRLRRGPYLRWVKPSIDFSLATIALLVLVPVLAAVSAAIYLKMGRPVLIRQRRVGRYGNEFLLYKFRTMEPDRRLNSMPYPVENDRRQTHKSADDPRLTSLGRRLRASRLDELPQFLNVAKGDMSLVGPRPELSEIVVDYEPWQHRRHAVKPGVTGLWQIAGETKLLKDCTEMELQYLGRISAVGDASIIVRTIPAMLRRNGI